MSEMPTPEMVEAAMEAFNEWRMGKSSFSADMRAAIAAALAAAPTVDATDLQSCLGYRDTEPAGPLWACRRPDWFDEWTITDRNGCLDDAGPCPGPHRALILGPALEVTP